MSWLLLSVTYVDIVIAILVLNCLSMLVLRNCEHVLPLHIGDCVYRHRWKNNVNVHMHMLAT